MPKSTPLDRKTRPYFYVIAFALMISGLILNWNVWLVGGGLAVFMIIVFQDARDEKDKRRQEDMNKGIEGLTNLARTKCQGCRHHPKNCTPVDIAHPETINIHEITSHLKACIRCRDDPGTGFEEARDHGDH